MIKICFAISAVVAFLTSRIEVYLDKQLENNKVPPKGSLVFYIIKQSLISFIYRFVTSSGCYKTKSPQNENEKKIIKLITLLNRLSLISTIVAVVSVGYLIFMNF